MIPGSIWKRFLPWGKDSTNSAREEMSIGKHTTLLRSDNGALYGNFQRRQAVGAYVCRPQMRGKNRVTRRAPFAAILSVLLQGTLLPNVTTKQSLLAGRSLGFTDVFGSFPKIICCAT
jgi:hypothetical protein